MSDMKYYDFLYAIQEISQKSHSIQNKVMSCVFENYDAYHLINKLDRQIAHLDGLLSN